MQAWRQDLRKLDRPDGEFAFVGSVRIPNDRNGVPSAHELFHPGETISCDTFSFQRTKAV